MRHAQLWGTGLHCALYGSFASRGHQGLMRGAGIGLDFLLLGWYPNRQQDTEPALLLGKGRLVRPHQRAALGGL